MDRVFLSAFFFFACIVLQGFKTPKGISANRFTIALTVRFRLPSDLVVYNRWRLALTDTLFVALLMNGLRQHIGSPTLPFLVFKPSSAYRTNKLFTARAAPRHFAHFYTFGYFLRFSI
jgi:hypothetical protein